MNIMFSTEWLNFSRCHYVRSSVVEVGADQVGVVGDPMYRDRLQRAEIREGSPTVAESSRVT